MRTIGALILALTMAFGVVSGCSGPSASAQVSAAASAQAGAATVVCGSLAALKVAVDVLRSLDPATTSKDTYAAAIDGVVGTWKVVQDSLARLGSTNSDLVSTAWRTFNDALQAQPTTIPVADALKNVKPEAEQLATAVKQVNTNLGCA